MTSLANTFCRCIKRVRRSVHLRPGQPRTKKQKERAAIGICVTSVLHTKGKTLKRFTCKNKKHGSRLTTQRRRLSSRD